MAVTGGGSVHNLGNTHIPRTPVSWPAPQPLLQVGFLFETVLAAGPPPARELREGFWEEMVKFHPEIAER